MSSARAGRGALEEHVLDEVRDAAARLGLVARAARQPHADRHRADVRHRLGDEPQTVVEDFADDHALWSGVRHLTVPPAPQRNGAASA